MTTPLKEDENSIEEDQRTFSGYRGKPVPKGFLSKLPKWKKKTNRNNTANPTSGETAREQQEPPGETEQKA